jgi:hypothetical protein
MRSMWWVWIFPLVGAGLLVGAAFSFRNTQRFLGTAGRCVGEVVEYSEYDSTDSDGRRTHMYTPLVRYTVDDRTIEKPCSVSTNSRDYKLGQRVKVVYDPADPEKFSLDSPFQLYMAPGILAFIGAIFLIIGCVVVGAFAAPKTELVDTPPELLHEDRDSDSIVGN